MMWHIISLINIVGLLLNLRAYFTFDIPLGAVGAFANGLGLVGALWLIYNE